MAKNSCQKKPKFSEILGTKVIQFSCYTKLTEIKNVLLNWYFSTRIFLGRFGWFLTLKIDFENQILALFDGYFWPFNKSHEKIKSIFVISAIIPSIWNVFIIFHLHDEKLTPCGQGTSAIASGAIFREGHTFVLTHGVTSTNTAGSYGFKLSYVQLPCGAPIDYTTTDL